MTRTRRVTALAALLSLLAGLLVGLALPASATETADGYSFTETPTTWPATYQTDLRFTVAWSGSGLQAIAVDFCESLPPTGPLSAVTSCTSGTGVGASGGATYSSGSWYTGNSFSPGTVGSGITVRWVLVRASGVTVAVYTGGGGLAPWDVGAPQEFGPDDGSEWENFQTCGVKAHCLVWTKPRPPYPPGFQQDWTFGVADAGMSVLAKDFVVGWTCAHLGPTLPPGPAEPTETQADFRYGVLREFLVDCPVGQYVWNFYVIDAAGDGDVDYSGDLHLFWGYGQPGEPTPTSGSPAADVPPSDCGDCGATPPGYAPTPAHVSPPAGDGPSSPTSPPAGCDFGLADPSSWLCGMSGLLGRILGAINGLGNLLKLLLLPNGAHMLAAWGDFRADLSTSAPWSYILAGPSAVRDTVEMFQTSSDPQALYALPASGDLDDLPLSDVNPWTGLDSDDGAGMFTVGTMRGAASAGIWLVFVWACYHRAKRVIGDQDAASAMAAANDSALS